MVSPLIATATRPSDLFEQMQQVFEAFDRTWGGSPMSLWGSEYPLVNVHVDEDGALITAELPGMDSKDVDLSLEHDTLTITGKRTIDVPKNARPIRRERRDVNFSRSLRLPFTADGEKVCARFENGVLSVLVPRKAEDKPRRIAIGKA